MKQILLCILPGIFLLLGLAGCRGGPTEGFACITDNDCPTPCRCDGEIARAICFREVDEIVGDEIVGTEDATCGGTCDRETDCPDGMSCQFELREDREGDDLLIYSCQPLGAGGGGGSGGAAGMGGSGGSPGADCAQGEFQLMPMAKAPHEIREEVCFHGESMLGPCPVYNYFVTSSEGHTDLDIFYGGPPDECDDSFLAEVEANGGLYMFFGEPTREPPTTADPSVESVATGTYNLLGDGESGTFEYYWPARP